MEIYSNVHLVGKSFKGETFARRKINKGLFRECDFSDCMFYDVSWGQGVIFDRCNFTHAQFRDCEADATTFAKCNFNEARFLDCLLDGSDFSLCRGILEFISVSFDKGRMVKCDFNGSSFIGSTFIGARISKSSLSGVDFANSDIAGAYLFNVALTDSNIVEADNISAATLKDCVIHPYSYWAPPKVIRENGNLRIYKPAVLGGFVDRREQEMDNRDKYSRKAHIYCSDIKEFLSS